MNDPQKMGPSVPVTAWDQPVHGGSHEQQEEQAGLTEHRRNGHRVAGVDDRGVPAGRLLRRAELVGEDWVGHGRILGMSHHWWTI